MGRYGSEIEWEGPHMWKHSWLGQSQRQTNIGYIQELANRILWLIHSYLWKKSEIVKHCLGHRILLNVYIPEREEIWLA